VPHPAAYPSPAAPWRNTPSPGVEPRVGDGDRNQPIGRNHHPAGDHACSTIVAPLHLLLFIPFLDFGVFLFHTRRLPLNRAQLDHLSRHPWLLIRSIWQWEWHALIVWGILAAVAMPLLAAYLRRVLVLFMRKHRTLLRSEPAAQQAPASS
jgi:hypothetical protein